MPCDHKGGPELIQMAEEYLRERDVRDWRGTKFRWSENVTGGMWSSVCVEIERRGDQWVVTRLDRNRETIPETDEGFRALS